MDCWLSAFYKVIWKSRNRKVLEKNKDITRQKRPRETDTTNEHPTKHIRLFIRSPQISSVNGFKFRFKIPISAKRKQDSTSTRNVRPRKEQSLQIPRATEEIPPTSSIVFTPQIISQIKRITLKLGPKSKHKIKKRSCREKQKITRIRLRLPREESHPGAGDENRLQGGGDPLRIECPTGVSVSELETVLGLDGSYD